VERGDQLLLAIGVAQRDLLGELAGADQLEQRVVEPQHAERAAALHEVRQLEQLVVADHVGQREHADEQLHRDHHAGAVGAGQQALATMALSAAPSDARTWD